MEKNSKTSKLKPKDLYESKGSKKITNYFMDLIFRKDFQAEVEKFREKYQIPPKGFELGEEHIFIDNKFPVPKNWIHSDKDRNFWNAFGKDESLIAKKFNLPPGNIGLIDSYVMYRIAFGAGSLCIVQDSNEIGVHPSYDKELNKHFPVSLRISPYTSKRDVINYVEKMFQKEIKPILEKYKDKKSALGKARTKSYALFKRDTFIYDHRHLPYKEIVKLVNKNFKENSKTIDQGSVGKIISLIEKKRNQV